MRSGRRVLLGALVVLSFVGATAATASSESSPIDGLVNSDELTGDDAGIVDDTVADDTDADDTDANDEGDDDVVVAPMVIPGGPARVFLEGPSSVAVGQPFTVDVMIDTGGATVNAVAAEINYPIRPFICTNVDTSTTDFDLAFLLRGNCTDGYAGIIVGSFAGVSGVFRVATLELIGGPCAVSGTLQFIDGTEAAGIDNGDPERVLGQATPKTIQVTPGTPTAPCPTTRSPKVVNLNIGTHVAGDVGSLRRDDDKLYEVQSSATTKARAVWTAVFRGVPNATTSVRISFRATCSFTGTLPTVVLQSYNTVTGTWDDLAPAVPCGWQTVTIPGTVADYVTNATGNGALKVRVRAVGTPPFTIATDLLRIAHW